MRLAVRIQEVVAGHIAVAASHDSIEFRPAESYVSAYPREVLGQIFEDDPSAVRRSRVRLPPFFSNLLPEGLLRGLLANQLGVRVEREPWLIAQLGEDLPGAVRVSEADTDDEDVAEGSAGAESTTQADGPLKFSLAGVQLKFSALRHDRGLTIPVRGLGGDWIVKLPDARHPLVPENEWSMLTWARESKIDTAEANLVDIQEIDGLPAEVGAMAESKTLAVRRFDRTDHSRVHIEDFAQVLNVYAEDKYTRANYETLGKIVLTVAGEDALREYIRRLVFVVASGNGDAHLKNWSFIYRDGLHASLSPAYDLVSTIRYLPDDELGLNFARSKAFASVSMSGFVRFASKIGANESLVVDEVQKSVSSIRESWLNLRHSLPLPKAHVLALQEHLDRVPLFAGRG